MKIILGLLAAVMSVVGVSFSTTYLVGSARTYHTLQQVTSILNAGDTVLVDGDQSYPGDLIFRSTGTSLNRIVILGVRINGNRPLISGGTNGVTFFTPDPYDGPGADHYTFQGFEVAGASFRGIYHQSKDLILRDVVVHNCPDGILGADQGSGSCLLEYSEIYACGSGQSYHQIYMATDEVHNPGSVFRMQFCYLHDGAGGNNVKSRAERNEIYYNWIEGAYYHELELVGPDGGDGGNPRLKREDSDVLGNVFWKKTKPSGDTEFFNVTRIGGDGTGETHGRYRFVNNTFLCGSRPVFRMFDSLESVEMHNNIFYRIDGQGVQIMRTVEALWTTGAEIIAGQNNWIQTGSTQVPSEWTGTIVGDDPGFADLVNNNVSPAAGSPLLDVGTSSPASPPGYPFPSPMYPPAYHPPMHALIAVGTASTRSLNGVIDIGAFELDPSLGVSSPMEWPKSFSLMQNYPNPFNPTTNFRFLISDFGLVSLKIYDLLGREMATLVNEQLSPGTYTRSWAGVNAVSGVYVYRLESSTASGSKMFVQERKMILVK